MVKLGDYVRDTVTELEGRIICECRYLNGCIQMQIQPVGITEKGEVKKREWVDIEQLVKVEKESVQSDASQLDRRHGGSGEHPEERDKP